MNLHVVSVLKASKLIINRQAGRFPNKQGKPQLQKNTTPDESLMVHRVPYHEYFEKPDSDQLLSIILAELCKLAVIVGLPL